MKKKWQPSFYELPVSIQNLLQKVVEQVYPEAIVLFGSRARGDHRENSDFDIAVKGDISEAQWDKVLVNLEDEPWSLYPIDLVQYTLLGEDYKKNIQIEGKTLYG